MSEDPQEQARRSATRFACCGMVLCSMIIVVCCVALSAVGWRLAQ